MRRIVLALVLLPTALPAAATTIGVRARLDGEPLNGKLSLGYLSAPAGTLRPVVGPAVGIPARPQGGPPTLQHFPDTRDGDFARAP